MKISIVTLFICISFMAFSQDGVKVEKGDKAIDFALETIDGVKVEMSEVNSENAVVLVVLRGWPEYQCPACSRQVGQYLAETEKFQELNANLLLVYPGPSKILQEKAKEFTEDFSFPQNFYFLIDPNYTMVNKYGLRWDAPKETAYPSTFVINKKGKIVYSNVSSSHGGRANVDEILGALESL